MSDDKTQVDPDATDITDDDADGFETEDSPDADSLQAESDVSTPIGVPAPLAPTRRLAVVALPALAVVAAAGAAFLGWQYASARDLQRAATESVEAARDTTAVILSYTPETVDAQLNGARESLTGGFLESYTTLVNDVVIPGAKEKKITAVAKVPAAASVSATRDHAVALVFVNQTVTMAADPEQTAPTTTNSSVRVTLDKVDGRWLVSGFDPV